jgi:thiol-disulfide isomerase/thioredoxin
MQFKKISFFIISVTILLTGCDSKEENTKKAPIETIKKVQTKFMLQTTGLTNINLEKTKEGMIFKGLENKVVLLNFWATWCLPCKAEIPHLNNLRKKYKDDFEIIAVNLDGPNQESKLSEKLNSFIKDYQIKYIVTNSKENYVLAKAMDRVKIIPTMFMFDTKGEIIQKYVGIVPEEMMETDIKKALGNK